MKTKLVTTILLLAFVIYFTIQNAKVVEIELFAYEFKIRRAILIFGAMYIGFVIGRYTKYITVNSK